jgi:hypothetical protein
MAAWGLPPEQELGCGNDQNINRHAEERGGGLAETCSDDFGSP